MSPPSCSSSSCCRLAPFPARPEASAAVTGQQKCQSLNTLHQLPPFSITKQSWSNFLKVRGQPWAAAGRRLACRCIRPLLCRCALDRGLPHRPALWTDQPFEGGAAGSSQVSETNLKTYLHLIVSAQLLKQPFYDSSEALKTFEREPLGSSSYKSHN